MHRRIVIGLSLTAILALLTTGVALAQGERLGGKLLTGPDISVPAGTTVAHDLYAFARSVDIAGTIDGDLVVAGGAITVSGPVRGDLIVGGGTVTVSGPVEGDVMAGAGQLTLSGPVSGDVRVGGGQVTIAGEISEDVLVGGGQVTISGRVGGDLIVGAGNLTLSGTVAGSTTGNVGSYVKTGTITGSDDIKITERLAGEPMGAPGVPRDPVLDAIAQFVGVMLFGLLALWLAPRAFAAAEIRVREQPLPALGWGVAAVIGYVVSLVVIAVLMVLAAVVLGSLRLPAIVAVALLGGFTAIAGLTLVFVVAAVFLADALVGLALARVVAQRAGWMGPAGTPAPGASTEARAPMSGRWAELGLLAVGAAVVVILTSLPAIGWAVKLFVVFVGLGAMWLARRPRRFGGGDRPA